jgi:hypothetical protein
MPMSTNFARARPTLPRRRAARGRRLASALIVGMTLLAVAGLAQYVGEKGDGRRLYPDDPIWQEPDRLDAPPIEVFTLTDEADFIIHSFQNPAGDGGPALNANTLGEVPDSSWFTNRIGHRPMTVEEIVRGPNRVDAPAPPPWTITGSPAAGITPKFFIRDSRGDTYIIKLDPPNMPELPSSAEMISTKIFHALGYNVPQNFLVYLRRDELRLGTDAKWKDLQGIERRIDESDVDGWINERAAEAGDGRVRALASKFIEGKFVGEYQYYGTRSDDPNDLYPHEKMRQLRGLRVFAAWLNHDDSRAINTFDSYVQENGRGFIKHFLIDFGSTLGSGSTLEQEPRAGYEYLVDRGDIGKGIITFGLWQRPWMKVKYPDYPAVGNVEAGFFEPWNWKPEYPNPAFERMDEADAFWAASLLVPFTDELLAAVVKTARISDPRAERYLLETLIARRDKCIRYWIALTNPLDRFEISGDGTQVSFDNAAVRARAAVGDIAYDVQWAQLDNLANKETAVGGEIRLPDTRMKIPEQAWGAKDDAGYRYAVARIRCLQPANPRWARPLLLTVRDKGGAYDIVGIDRPRTDAEVKYDRKKYPERNQTEAQR